MKTSSFSYRFFALGLVACLFALPAFADEIDANHGDTMDVPVVSETADDSSATHPILRLTQDKSEMIKLDGEAASVIVGNPNHVSVLIDAPDTLVVVPRMAGASHFSVVGKDGSVIMQRHVIVGSPREQYVRIRRSCGSNSAGCQPTSVYFCPDICHEVSENTASSSRRR